MERFSIRDAPPIGTKVVTVVVGTEPELEDFTVHEELLRRSSDFFNAALNNDWAEAGERLIRLPTGQPASFYIYVQWLYSARLFSKGTLSQATSSTAGNNQEWTSLIQCYFLANYLQDVDFKDTLMDALMQWTAEVPQLNRNATVVSAKEIYDNTEDGSPLRKFFVDLSVWKVEGSVWENEEGATLPYDFLRAVTIGLSRRLQPGQTLQDVIDEKNGTCHYHAHGNNPCYKSKSPR
ncbi:hypothetical protein BDV96DRAFT_639194 [Lophiotrema nucula]|uniref:BTB domain-containing protein n=1 Tax=Lophiotrema nucula TaxID=690887 RepID=A0A6A5ZUX9_9PLEO|nr:hypothetical protein BDV96DRAFT_639194 [Lophiotrema nucula]